jgi:hypothetical protein
MKAIILIGTQFPRELREKIRLDSALLWGENVLVLPIIEGKTPRETMGALPRQTLEPFIGAPVYVVGKIGTVKSLQETRGVGEISPVKGPVQ